MWVLLSMVLHWSMPRACMRRQKLHGQGMLGLDKCHSHSLSGLFLPPTPRLSPTPTHIRTHARTHTHANAPTHIFTRQHSLHEALLCILRKVTFGSPVILNLHKKVFLFVSACISVWACNLPLVGCFHSELTRCKMLYLVCRVSGNVETSFT